MMAWTKAGPWRDLKCTRSLSSANKVRRLRTSSQLLFVTWSALESNGCHISDTACTATDLHLNTDVDVPRKVDVTITGQSLSFIHLANPDS